MVLRVLVVHGETWALSRKMANEIKMVIIEYISMPQTVASTKPCSTSVTDWSRATSTGVMGGGLLDGLIHDSLNMFPEFDFSGMVGNGTPSSGPSPPQAPGAPDPYTDPSLPANPELWLNGGEHMGTSSGMNGLNGTGAGAGRMNGNGNGMLDPSMGIATGPPVLDATWQALVEQLGF